MKNPPAPTPRGNLLALIAVLETRHDADNSRPPTIDDALADVDEKLDMLKIAHEDGDNDAVLLENAAESIAALLRCADLLLARMPAGQVATLVLEAAE